MANPTPLKADPGINQPLIIRRARAATIVFRFWTDEDHTIEYDITDDFRFILKPMAESSEDDALIDITNADDLVIDGNEIRVPLTVLKSDIDRKKCYYELINTTTDVNWFQDEIQIVTGKAPSITTVTEVDQTLTLGENVVETTITVAGFDVSSLTDAQKAALATALAPYLL